MNPMMGMGGGGAQPLSGSVFIKKLPNNLSLEDLVNEVGIYGPIESYRVDNDRHEAFVNFVEGSSAAALFADGSAPFKAAAFSQFPRPWT